MEHTPAEAQVSQALCTKERPNRWFGVRGLVDSAAGDPAASGAADRSDRVGMDGLGSTMWKPFSSVEDARERRLLVAVVAPMWAILPLLWWSEETNSRLPLIGIAVAGVASLAVLGVLLVFVHRRDGSAWRGMRPFAVSPEVARGQPGALVPRVEGDVLGRSRCSDADA